MPARGGGALLWLGRGVGLKMKSKGAQLASHRRAPSAWNGSIGNAERAPRDRSSARAVPYCHWCPMESKPFWAGSCDDDGLHGRLPGWLVRSPSRQHCVFQFTKSAEKIVSTPTALSTQVTNGPSNFIMLHAHVEQITTILSVKRRPISP